MNIEQMVIDSRLDTPIKQSMLGTIQWLRKQSISQTGRDMAQSLLGNKEYLQMNAEQFFSHCYNIRSQIVHTGTPKDIGIDLLELANSCQAFTGDLLQASFDAATA
jgi:hypothetical protein